MNFKSTLFKLTCLIVMIEIFVENDSKADMDIKWTLQEVIKTNPEIMADRAAARADEFVIDRAKSGYLPKVDVNAGAGWENVKSKLHAVLKCNASKSFCTTKRFRRTAEL